MQCWSDIVSGNYTSYIAMKVNGKVWQFRNVHFLKQHFRNKYLSFLVVSHCNHHYRWLVSSVTVIGSVILVHFLSDLFSSIAILDGIIFLLGFNWLLLIQSNSIDLKMISFYLSTLMDSLINFNSLFIDFLGILRLS